jgi:hypothetical protein
MPCLHGSTFSKRKWIISIGGNIRLFAKSAYCLEANENMPTILTKVRFILLKIELEIVGITKEFSQVLFSLLLFLRIMDQVVEVKANIIFDCLHN